jgi:hypothetical protein
MKKLLGLIFATALALGSPARASNLCNVGITTAVTGSTTAAVSGFGAPTSMSVEGRFTYVASAATSADVYIQTTIDGSNWFDVANFHWTTASAWVLSNVITSAAVANTSLGSGTLSSNTAPGGTLTNQYRCYITTVGTYGSGSNVTVNIYPRY